MKWNCNFNNWIRKLFFFFFRSINFLYSSSKAISRISSTVKKKKKKNEASLSKDIKIFSFRNSGLIMSEKNFVFQSRFSFPRKGRNRISRIHSFERTKSWTNMSEKTGENERSRLDDALSNVDYEGKSNDFFSFSSLLLLPARSKPTCSGSRIRGPAFTFDFYMLPFLPPHESQPTNPSPLTPRASSRI